MGRIPWTFCVRLHKFDSSYSLFPPTSSTWERTGGDTSNTDEKFVVISITCFDTRHPTGAPTKSPTFSPTTSPTSAPTESCEALIITGSGLTDYDGIYNKATGTINEYDWWQSRNDVGGVGQNLQVKLYYYTGVFGYRWRLEGPGYSFWAADDTISRDELTGGAFTATRFFLIKINTNKINYRRSTVM